MTLDPTLLSNLLLVLTGFGGAFLAALWIALVIWTYRDIRTRARDPLSQTLATLLVAVLSLPGVLVYLILRPPKTLEETNPPPLRTTNQTSNSYNPGTLYALRTYYSKIVARDNHGSETVSPILSFTTLNNPPQFFIFAPENGETGVNLTPALSWLVSDPDLGDSMVSIYTLVHPTRRLSLFQIR